METAKKTQKKADKLRVNLFFDPEVRARQAKQLEAKFSRSKSCSIPY